MTVRKTKAWHLLASLVPKKLAYFCAVRVTAYGTTGKYGNTVVPELTAMDALKRYADDHNLN